MTNAQGSPSEVLWQGQEQTLDPADLLHLWPHLALLSQRHWLKLFVNRRATWTYVVRIIRDKAEIKPCPTDIVSVP